MGLFWFVQSVPFLFLGNIPNFMFFLSGSYPISESMQTLNGVTGESVLSTTSTGYHDDTEYHRLDTAAPPSGFYDNNATEFYPVPEHKYRPPLVRMNSGTSRFYYSLNSKTRGLLSKVGSTRGAYYQQGAYYPCFNIWISLCDNFLFLLCKCWI